MAAGGGNGGGSGGLSRSVLDFTTSDKVHCTINTSITQFGDYLSATCANGINPGTAKGGNDFNNTGGRGGYGGNGAQCIKGSYSWNDYPSSDGGKGANNGSSGGKRGQSPASGGGGGGGACYTLPSNIKYDDPLYTTYIKHDLSSYKGGDGDSYYGAGYPSSYPAFNSKSPVWYGGGNGGGGGNDQGSSGTPGSAGSPGGILIEKAVY